MNIILTCAVTTAVALAAASSFARDAGTPATGPTPRVLTVTAFDYAFQAPDTVAAGMTEIRLVNNGPELHHVWLMRLPAGKTMGDVFREMEQTGHPPHWVEHLGGPNAPAPSAAATAAVHLTPGEYLIVCVIPSPDGTPHIMKGMVKTLTVVPSAEAAPTPVAELTMSLTDYDFVLSKPLTAGRRTILVRNDASQPHEVVIAKLAPGKTAADMVAWVEKMEGPPPGLPLGGTTGMSARVENFVTIDFEPGEYALLCFVPDATDGRMHVAHGMVKQMTVE